MINKRLSRIISILLAVIHYNDGFSQALINSSGNSIQNSSISVDYSVGEISIVTLQASEKTITQGLLQPIINFKNCNMLQLIPNAFTPNNDNINDCFGVKNWPVTSSYELSIYNRWGQLLFTSMDLSGCWDGNFKGAAQPVGAYIYTIKANTVACGYAMYKGSIILIR